MRILIAGKRKTMRSALKRLLQTRSGYDVVGMVADREELFIQVETKSPDLLLLDEDLTEMLAEDVILPLQQIDPCPKIIVLSGRPESKKVYLEAGITTYLEKVDPPKSLLTAIEEIRLGKNHG